MTFQSAKRLEKSNLPWGLGGDLNKNHPPFQWYEALNGFDTFP